MIFREVNLVGNHDGLGFGLVTFEMHRPSVGFDVPNTAESRQKVQMPVSATELAVGDGAQAVFKLLGNELLISASSMAVSSSLLIWPQENLTRACATVLGRRKLPTTSQRYGGLM